MGEVAWYEVEKGRLSGIREWCGSRQLMSMGRLGDMVAEGEEERVGKQAPSSSGGGDLRSGKRWSEGRHGCVVGCREMIESRPRADLPYQARSASEQRTTSTSIENSQWPEG
jgi:hypothetical protein